jgi:Tfp pilus assembly protein PilN
MQRMALRLLAEGVLEHLPLTILMVGMQNEVADQCAAALNRAFPRAQISRNPLSSGSTTPAPVLRDDVFDLPPAEAREERRALRKRQKLLSFATAGAVFYLLLLVWAAGYFFIKQTALKRLQQEVSHLQAPSLNAQDESDRWHTFRSAIDPATYALDLLAAVASPTEGGKIRLTLYSLEQGTLHISGEATDITQAYNFIEQLKKNPRLQEYNWNAGVPQIAGKSGVRFDIEGTRIDAPHETTGS